MAKFDTTLRDSQGTEVAPIDPKDFDLEAYRDYEESMQEKNKAFFEGDHGLLVYRRVRANGVFYDKCRDYRESLALQLGALKAGMAYKADIANFLEPWYGIGYIAASFGSDYHWEPEQAPNVKAKFHTLEEILNADYVPIAQTKVGRYQLEMIEYFMDQTKGNIPVSFGDIQSPLNMLTYLLPITDMFYELMDDPDSAKKVARILAELLRDFLKEEEKLIGDALAKPGHGFASSRAFEGLGMSNDTSIMLKTEDYEDIFKEADQWLCDQFGGFVYHSCGVWEKKIDMVKGYADARTADGAFTIETDPNPNDPEKFADPFAGSGIILNARAVGNADDSFAAFQKLWRPNQKLICVTYCKTPEEQEVLYERLHAMEAGEL